MSRKTDKAKLQSAMEYLMTYGWAILIIAVVLGALFQLGVFNSTNFAPRAPPGSCRVFRLSGIINLEGVCSGELPQYVASFPSSAFVQVGQDSRFNFGNAITPFTITAWVNPQSTTPTTPNNIVGNGACGTGGYRLRFDSGGLDFFLINTAGSQVGGIASTNIRSKVFSFVTAVDNGANLLLYVNGNNIATSSALSAANIISPASYLTIGYDFGSGSGGCGSEYYSGTISNVQIYNTSLSANDVQALYVEGIGSAPPFLRSLVGWWPLNGDTNDYSGNNNNGAPTSISYTNQWLSGYTPP